MASAPNELRNWIQPRLAPAFLVFAALMASLLTGCHPGTDTSSGIAGTGPVGGSGGGGAGGGEPCAEGDSKSCHIPLGEHNNVVSCFDGVQSCKGGVWGPCEGESANHPKPPPPPVGCMNNPCDPTCQSFNETPATPIGSPPQNLIAPWLQGSYGSLPPAIQGQLSKEPCSDGSACQGDQYCNNPVSGTCAHNKCVTGGGLLKSCDPDCVTKICGASPGCCATPVPADAGSGGTSCAHDLCETGAPLARTNAGAGTVACDNCVNLVCQASWAHCCDISSGNGKWTAECVERAQTICGKNCASGTWDSSCVGLVDTYCNAKCLEDTAPPTCAHDKCLLGDGLDQNCDPCVQAICSASGLSGCCSGSAGAWNGQCVQAVASVCQQTCPAKGDCVPWLPTQKDGKCTGTFDLTVGVGCTSAGVAKVPVCNRGLAPPQAGLVLAVFPAAPALIPQVAPPIATAIATIPLPAIAPGACVDVDLPAGTPDGAQLMVNPTTDPSYAANMGSNECHNNNNWGVWSSATGACDAPSCAGASAFSKLKKLKLFFTVDVSGSMGRSIADSSVFATPSRWSTLSDALIAFMQGASDDTAVWLRFWPNSSAGACPGPAVCGPLGGCAVGNADVPDLTAPNEAIVTNAISTVPLSGVTPMYPAIDGATQAAIAFQKANPDWNAVVILVTDGNPSTCITTPSKLAALTGAAFYGYGIRSYAIGLTTEINKTTTDLIASTGGGKGFYVDTNNVAQFQTDLVAALNSIKQDFVSCTLALPNQDIFDPNQAVITYTPGVGAPIALPQVADLGDCAGDGWYYDDPADPASITLCPTTCSAVKLDSNGKLELNIDCIQQYLPSQYSEVYQAVCPAGTTVQWGFLAYDATVPGDSHIDFRAQTSSDNITYSALQAMPISIATAGSPDCAMAGPSPCPVDLYNALSKLPNAQKQYLRLVADITPTSDKNQTPTINTWQVTYSCPDTE